VNDQIVLAAGGIISNDLGELLIIHRPKYDDWSFPKGKLDFGEKLEECAIREVHEETGFRCSLGEELGLVTYQDRKGRKKEVHYWRMHILEGVFKDNDEVDKIHWSTIDEAMNLLSYAHDQKFLLNSVV
jgi:8-oxo-dGTP diphosphatase